MNIPDYIDCENNTKFCDWYMNLDCPESCDYVRLILEGGEWYNGTIDYSLKEYKNCLIYQRLSEPLGIGSPSPEDWINKIIKYKNKKK